MISPKRKLEMVILHQVSGLASRAGICGRMSLRASKMPSMSLRCRKHQLTIVEPLLCRPAQRNNGFFPSITPPPAKLHRANDLVIIRSEMDADKSSETGDSRCA